MIEQKVGQRGTDEAFFKLMTLSGDALLKLLGMDAQTAETYHFRATVLKEKRLSPDIEGWSLMAGNQPRVLLEFHGYEDPYIRYRLASKVFMSCAQDSYHGQVLAGIIFTGEQYRKAALSLTPLERRAGCRFDECFVEVVLSDFSEEQLKAIDPRLLVLAPLTMQANTDPELLKSKGRRWHDEIKDIFDGPSRSKALEIIGLFAVAQFRSFTVQEITQMFNFDPNPEWVFTKAYNEGCMDGRKEGRQEGKAALLLKLMRRKFGQTPDWVTEKVTAANLELIEKWSDNFVFANSVDEIFAS